ncbi:fatty acid desaturase [Pseudomonas purpurea]|uniref:fatty acid desaturase n=1 Tax=Pseudomonas purpurea TaxID=3136737 RepID=UPI0032637660
MSTSTDTLYPQRPANISRLFHFFAIPLFSVLMVFNLAAVAVILVIAFTLQGARWLLAKIPGVSAASGAWVRGYHRLVQRLANKILKDPRDEQILAAAISLSVTAVPVFIAQLWLKEISWPLVVAFYACVYGPNIRSFVRSFSAMHQDGHVPGGIFKQSSVLDRWVGNSFLYMYFAIPMGLTPHAAAHLQQHHRESAGPLDVYATARYDHANLWHFMVYMVREVMYQQLLISPWLYFKSKDKPTQARSMVAGVLVHLGVFVALALYSLPIAVLYMLVPWCASNILMGVIHWSQHAFYGGQQDPHDWMYNTVTLLEKPVNIFNEGYHACHHHWSIGHWSEAPALFEKLKPELAAAQSMVFRDLSVLDIFFMLIFRRFDAMAHKLDWWEPLTHEEKVQLLRRRVLPAPIHAHEQAHQHRTPAPSSAPEPQAAYNAMSPP